MDYFVFGEVDSRDYNVWIYPQEIDSAPQREYQEVVIAGRNGTLTVDGGRYENIDHVYQGIIFSDNAVSDLVDFRNALTAQIDYKRLEDSINTSEYYEARFMEMFTPIVEEGRGASKFEIKFNRKPQRFLKSGETATSFTASGNITNPTKFASRPLIVVTGTGSVGVGNQTVTIDGTSGQVSYIDCDMQEAYKVVSGANVSINSDVTFTGTDFPTLPSGRSGVSLGSGITKVEITPRWYRL